MVGGPLREPAPQVVVDRLAAIGADIWAIALDLANARLATEREALEKTRAELEAGRDEAAGLADKLVTEVESLQSSLARAEAAEAGLRLEADELRASLAAAVARADIADVKAHEIELRANELRTELDRAHDKDRRAQDDIERLSNGLICAGQDR